MKILLLISLTILASVSLGERVCKTVSGKLPGMNFALGQSVCLDSRLQPGNYNDPFSGSTKYGVLLWVEIIIFLSDSKTFYPALRTQGEYCLSAYGGNYCLTWNWKPKEVCFTVILRSLFGILDTVDYGCQTLKGSILFKQ